MEHVQSLCVEGSLESPVGFSVGANMEDGGWQAGREAAAGGKRSSGPRFAGGPGRNFGLRGPSVLIPSSHVNEVPKKWMLWSLEIRKALPQADGFNRESHLRIHPNRIREGPAAFGDRVRRHMARTLRRLMR